MAAVLFVLSSAAKKNYLTHETNLFINTFLSTRIQLTVFHDI
jgi:hypothetical protein